MSDELEPKRVLLLDGETRSALAAVRSLGAAGYEVAVAANRRPAIAQSSKFASYAFRCPDPCHAPDMYCKWLYLTVEQWQPDILLPVTDASLYLCLRSEEALREHTILPTIGREILQQVADKGHLMQVAERLGLRVPKTVLLPELRLWAEADSLAVEEMRYPAVLKPRMSIYDLGSRLGKAEMRYVDSAGDVRPLLEELCDRFAAWPAYMLQECIEGEGIGVFALFRNGRCLIDFCHQRLLEKPPSGGRSVLSKSIPPGEAPVEEALRLLEHFHWEGAAMVEFKRNTSGAHFLMEINPRLWGSLQLAVDAGRDFPKLLCDTALSPQIDTAQLRAELGNYSTGARLRWLLGTLDHLLIRLKCGRLKALKEVVLRNSLQLGVDWRKTRWELCRLSDIRPFLAELRSYIVDLFKR